MTMGRPCSVCSHPRRDEINSAIAGGQTFGRLSATFGVSSKALARHKENHLSKVVERAAAKVEQATQRTIVRREVETVEQELDLLGLIGRSVRVVTKMQDACEEFLTDPANSARYTLQPRAHELTVIYLEPTGEEARDGTARMQQRSAPLSELIERAEEKLDITVLRTKWTVTDPRKLVLEASAALRGHVEFLAGLMLRSRQELEREIDVFLDELRGGISTGAWDEIGRVLAHRREVRGEASQGNERDR